MRIDSCGLRLLELHVYHGVGIDRAGVAAISISLEECGVGIHLHSRIAECVIGLHIEAVLRLGSDIRTLHDRDYTDILCLLKGDMIGIRGHGVLLNDLLEVLPVFLGLIFGLATHRHDKTLLRGTCEHTPVDPSNIGITCDDFPQVATACEHVVLPCAYRPWNLDRGKTVALHETAVLESGKIGRQYDSLE